MKKVVVISLGGSLIIPYNINVKFLEEFKNTLIKNSRKHRFVVVCGGGSVARYYINGLENQHLLRKRYLQTSLGIRVTNLNARFMINFFTLHANKTVPKDMKDVRDYLKKYKIVFCGALRYERDQTSDSTSARLAHFFHCDFINLTDVNGVYTENPKKYKKAKFISDISQKEFLKMANKIKFKPGQHFVLDQTAAKIIKKYKIRTFIIGPDMKNFDNLLNGKHFVGTIIE